MARMFPVDEVADRASAESAAEELAPPPAWPFEAAVAGVDGTVCPEVADGATAGLGWVTA